MKQWIIEKINVTINAKSAVKVMLQFRHLLVQIWNNISDVSRVFWADWS